MRRIRIGTRRSDLARTQTELVRAALVAQHGDRPIEIVPLSTQGDNEPERPVDARWPVGAFVNTIERALFDGEVDIAVHSYKDLPSTIAPGLTIAAVPARASVHDVLLTAQPVQLDALPEGLAIGTSSPRRAAQIRQYGDVTIMPMRGNVPTRVARIGTDGIDGVILAAAGLERLGIHHPHAIALPVETCPPAPAQGALAIEVRADDDELLDLVAPLHHRPTGLAVDAERAFMAVLGDICSTPLAALGRVDGRIIDLHAQLFTASGTLVEHRESGTDAIVLGTHIGTLLRDAVGRATDHEQ